MADRQWFSQGVQIFETGEEEYFVGGVQVCEDQAASGVTGTTTWGHTTGVTETNTLTFDSHWTGTGAISGSGDSEIISLDDGEYMHSDIVTTGSETVTLIKNNYGSNGDAEVVMSYRTAATSGGITAESWTAYTVPFASSGYVQIRVEN